VRIKIYDNSEVFFKFPLKSLKPEGIGVPLPEQTSNNVPTHHTSGGQLIPKTVINIGLRRYF
jgi:hypothetical protein